MQLISIELSKVVFLAHMVRPQGQLFRPHAAAALAQRYFFQGGPTSMEQLESNPVRFHHGLFNDFAIGNLAIYEDGIIAESQTATEILEPFLDDLLAWIGAEFGIYQSDAPSLGRLFESTVVVRLDASLAKAFPPSGVFQRTLEQAWRKERPNSTPKFEMTSIRWGVDPATTKVPVPGNFVLERRVNTPFDHNLFFSQAPFKTSDHLRLLTEFERLLA